MTRLRFTLTGVLAITAIAGFAGLVGGHLARANVVTISGNNLRNGWDSHEPGLSPATLKSGTFGPLFRTPVDGQVFAQPIVAGPILVIATQNDNVYGLDPTTGAVTWSRSLGTPWPSATVGCPDVNPNVGVMGTPVYDPATWTVYVMAEVIPAGQDAHHPAFLLHALSARTGLERSGWPVQIQGPAVNDPSKQFNAVYQWQRTGLLRLGRSVYAAFGSHCDLGAYTGYVAGVNTATRAQSIWSDESGLTNTAGGIWQSGGGLMSDGPARIFLSSGNGVSPAPGPGSRPPGQLADAIVRLGVSASGVLSARDFFSPADAPILDANDGDFGSGGPVGLPFGTLAAPDLLVQAGKDGRIFVLNRDDLGGREQGPGGADQFVAQAGPFAGEFAYPPAFGDVRTLTEANAAGANDLIYYLGTGSHQRGAGGPLRVLKFGLNATGRPVIFDVASTTTLFGFSSGSPVLTSNGTDPASAVVWDVYSTGNYGQGTLEAYQAVPPASCTAGTPCLLPELWSAPLGAAAKFTVPATDSGRVYVGTADGEVLGFGSPDHAPLTGAPPVNFGRVAVGQRSPAQTVTIHATTTVQVSKIATSSARGSNPFTVRNPVPLPVTLQPGQTLTATVHLAPTGPGGFTGAVNFTTDSAGFPVVSVPLSGTGTQPGFYAVPATVNFGPLPVGRSATASLVIVNGAIGPETVSSVVRPEAPFSASGLPTGTVPSGISRNASVTFQPTAVGPASSQIVITAADGTSLTVQVTGTGESDVSRLAPSPGTVSFGSVPVGVKVTRMIKLTNTGNLPATIAATATPRGPFGHPLRVPAGLPLNPSYDIQVPVTFTPPRTGEVSGVYSFTWTDVTGTHRIAIRVTGTGTAPASAMAIPHMSRWDA